MLHECAVVALLPHNNLTSSRERVVGQLTDAKRVDPAKLIKFLSEANQLVNAPGRQFSRAQPVLPAGSFETVLRRYRRQQSYSRSALYALMRKLRSSRLEGAYRTEAFCKALRHPSQPKSSTDDLTQHNDDERGKQKFNSINSRGELSPTLSPCTADCAGFQGRGGLGERCDGSGAESISSE